MCLCFASIYNIFEILLHLSVVFLLRLRIFSLIHFSFIIISHWFTWYNVYLRGTCAVLPYKTDISVRSGSSGVFFLNAQPRWFFSLSINSSILFVSSRWLLLGIVSCFAFWIRNRCCVCMCFFCGIGERWVWWWGSFTVRGFTSVVQTGRDYTRSL